MKISAKNEIYKKATLRSPSNILGSSDGLTGSTAIFTTDCVLNFRGLGVGDKKF
jgi:hypothetical protein